MRAPLRSLPGLGLLILCCVALAGCGGDGAGPDASPVDAGSDAAADGGGTDGGPDATTDGGEPGCPRTAGPADGPRRVVVSHPFDADGMQDVRWEVLDLSADGTLSAPGVSFEMGRGASGEIAFTPDGQVGIVAQEDGSLGVFRFEDDGTPVVVHARFGGDFYASHVVMDPSGARAWVLDTEFRDIGGGIYEVAIGCDGELTALGQRAAAKLPADLAFLGDGSRALVAAKDVLSSGEMEGEDAHLLDWSADPITVTASVDAFGDDDQIVSSVAVTADERYALVADNGVVTAPDNRVAVVGIDGETLSAVDVLGPIEDPYDVVASPFDDAALVVSGFGDAIFRVAYDPTDTAAPFALGDELTYEGARPQLPANAVMVERGSLRGLVLVAENVGVRRVRFEGGGEVTDLGNFVLGSGNEVITGAIGVTP